MRLLWLRTIVRDTRALYRFGIVKAQLLNLKWRNETVGSCFDKLAKKKGKLPCFFFNDKTWSYRQVELESNRIGNYFQQEGFVKGDRVALFMTNRIEIIIIWLGLSKIGVVPALVNSNLASDVLRHSITIVNPRAVICGTELLDVLNSAYPGEKDKIPVYCSGVAQNHASLGNSIYIDKALSSVPEKTPIPSKPINFTDDLFYIYTSGTTGLPKAAIIKHSRYFLGSHGMSAMIGIKPTDILYTSFPLQHTTAGIIATGFALHRGVPAAIRAKFSASEFWKDCIKYNATVAQYIGEACRYLLKNPVTPEETQHKLRMISGNGLRQEIWTQFQERFKIPLIVEFYGSTEGNCNLFNIFGHTGAFGFIPPHLNTLLPITLIKLDDEDRPLRDPKTGLLIQSRPGENGELIGKMVTGDPTREFQGYVGDKANSEKKIIENVLKKGDRFFRSGDLCVRDELGYFYFKDRIGESYRFKGENVSATQVEGAINKITNIHDVVVFGVKVPNVDGSVGMAVLADPSNQLDLDALANGIVKELPEYARPRFLRLPTKIENTMTHKLKKSEFKKDGIDLQKIGRDKVYIFQNEKYNVLTPEILGKLNSGEIQL